MTRSTRRPHHSILALCFLLMSLALPALAQECDDGRVCTKDVLAGGECTYSWLEGPDYGDFGRCCEENQHCDDRDPCTKDLCDADNNSCSHFPIQGCTPDERSCADGECPSGVELVVKKVSPAFVTTGQEGRDREVIVLSGQGFTGKSFVIVEMPSGIVQISPEEILHVTPTTLTFHAPTWESEGPAKVTAKDPENGAFGGLVVEYVHDIRTGAAAPQTCTDRYAPDTGLAAFFPFDEGRGTNLAGTGDAELINHPEEVAGRIESGLRFDGQKAHALVAHDDAFDLGGCDESGEGACGLTVELWIRTAEKYGTLADKREKVSETGNRGWSMVLDEGRAVFRLEDGAKEYEFAASSYVADDTWHHVAAVVEQEAVTLVVDGEVEAHSAFPGGAYGNTAQLWLAGARPLEDPGAVVSNPYQGSLDEFTIHAVPLTPDQIRRLFGTPGGICRGDLRPYDPYGPITGLADIHSHIFAEHAWGGGWYHGSTTSPQTVCDGGGIGSDHGRLRDNVSSFWDGIRDCGPFLHGPEVQVFLDLSGPILSELIGLTGVDPTDGTAGDTGLHPKRTDPGVGWPRWDAIAHQAAWEDWLEDAHDEGMKLTVMLAQTYDILCQLMPPGNLDRPSCDPYADIVTQLDDATAFAASRSWVEIALSPLHARQIIRDGKMAMVLGVESSHVFEGISDPIARLHDFHDRGVRTIIPIHEEDNRFGGAALHNEIFQFFQLQNTCHEDIDCGDPVFGFDVELGPDGTCRNVRGLTQEGHDFLQEMMNLGMPIDLSHMSELAREETFALSEANDFFPLYTSHGHFRDIMPPATSAHEKTSPVWEIQMIRKTGGMFGMRPDPASARTYLFSGVADDCEGSSKSFAQAFTYGANELGVDIAFGADHNGFIKQTRPRFYHQDQTSAGVLQNGACSGAVLRAEQDCDAAAQTDPVGSTFDIHGAGDVGQLPDLVEDLENLGVDTNNLWSSAENFVRMWERAESTSRTGPVDPAADLTGYDPEPVLSTWLDRPARRAPFIMDGDMQCDTAFCRAFQEEGLSCRFDAECESGRCAGNDDLCGLWRGSCVCDGDADCPGGEYCERNGPGYADNVCQPLVTGGGSCSSDNECVTGDCGGCGINSGRCFVPDSSSYGDTCWAQNQCDTGRCSGFPCGTGSCLCTRDSDCASNQWCDVLPGQCRDKLLNGSECVFPFDSMCQSDNCFPTPLLPLGFCAP
ncbi:MAG: hypothetical protein GY719_18915 [bacterium]|nr:hypothetical protein [bacterium]